MSLVVLREVGVFGGGERGSEMPSNSRVAMRRGARPGVSVVWFIWVGVRGVLKKVVIVVVGLIVVMLRGFLVVLVLRVRRGRPFVLVDGIVRRKDGFVLMVVDHHAADHTAHCVSNHLLLACAELRLLGYYCTACSWQRVLKALRWGRDNRDRGESLCKESRGCIGALLGGHVLGLLRLLGLVWIKSCHLVLFSPSQGWCTEAPKLLRAPLWVTIIIPDPIIYHLNEGRLQRAAIAAWGHFSSSSCLSRKGRVVGTGNPLLRRVMISVRVLLVKLPVVSRGRRISSRSCGGHRSLVHDLILSRRASTFIAHRRPILGVCPRHRAEVVPRLPRKMQVKSIEGRVPLQEVVDL